MHFFVISDVFHELVNDKSWDFQVSNKVLSLLLLLVALSQALRYFPDAGYDIIYTLLPFLFAFRIILVAEPHYVLKVLDYLSSLNL